MGNITVWIKLNQLWDATTNEFLAHEKVDIRVRSTVTWMVYQSIIAAIPSLWGFYIRTPRLIDNYVHKFLVVSEKRANISGWVYKDMLQSKETLQKLATLWNTKLGTRMSLDDFENYFKHVYELTYVTKLRDFQYRFSVTMF